MIKVCDAIMGSGKTQAAITYMNEHHDRRYIYITPYLNEADRIADSCPSLNFAKPLVLKNRKFSKVCHTEDLIKQRRNIASTHQAFRSYTDDILSEIRDAGYTLVVDECIKAAETYMLNRGDLKLLMDAGYIKFEDGAYKLIKNDYFGIALKDMFDTFRTHNVMSFGNDQMERRKDYDHIYYWILPPEFITSFSEVIVLTYMFEGQSMDYFFQLHGLEYKNIWVERVRSGNGYRFCDHPGYIPEYVNNISNMIEIYDNERMNMVGDGRTALSKTWFLRHKGSKELTQIKRNLEYLFGKIWRDSSVETRLWSTLKSSKDSISGKGYASRFIAMNAKASNEFSKSKYLAYVLNIFMNVSEKTMYSRHGITVDEDRYALSIMIQWIWRSAIRNGEKIHLYLPSGRMRRILTEWMKNVEEGGDKHRSEEKVQRLCIQ